jgi:hypothetical protein
LEKQGKVESATIEQTYSGPVFGGFRVRHRFVDITDPAAPKVAIEEVWDIKVYARREAYLVDLESTQTCATASPLVVLRNHYGGFGFRGAAGWDDPEAMKFLTSDGRSRSDGNGTPVRWCVMSGALEGEEAAVGFLGHPSNTRAPERVRLHPKNAFFCWVPAHGEDLQLEPGKALVSRYRFLVRDSAPTASDMEGEWAGYAEPPRVELSLKDARDR